ARMLIKQGRYGKYLACSAYPDCRNIQPLVKPKGLGITCPACNEGELMEKTSKRGKIFYSCGAYPRCKYALWDRPEAVPCPQCGSSITTVKTTKRYGTVRRCPNEGCDWQETLEAPAKADK
ncbi:MAG: DNA topoisomerase I, partial [Deltaproteobacteria bacterium]